MPFTPNIIYLDSVTSTNTEAARHAQAGAPEGVTVVANEQTAGRGRLDRYWVSPLNAGLYASIILRPSLKLESWTLIPLMAAVSVHEALIDSCDLDTDIKWPNDIIAGERKLCGILAETIDTSVGRVAILGIGINLTSAAFPSELADVATSVEEQTGKRPDRDVLLYSLLSAVAKRYEELQSGDGGSRIIAAWIANSSYSNGKKVLVTSAEMSFEGVTRGLERDGALRVETVDGEIIIVRAGDVTRLRANVRD
jgi:BirA family biotin operon repressor/biotin-[acetyl-CoA-carboxylase] ligase